MSETRSGLPSFDNPPLVEMALGAEFSPLEQWGIPHFGLFWSLIRGKYPDFNVVYPPTQVQPWQVVPIFGPMPVRCQFLTQDRTHLIQIQNDRVFYNWQRPPGGGEYPRYVTIRPNFEEEWSKFTQFLESENLDQPSVQVCEVTYVNHLEQGQDWQTLSDLPDVLTWWRGMPSSAPVSSPTAISLDAVYPLPDADGQLRIQVQPGLRNADAKQILQVALTARSKPASSQIQSVLACLDSNHEAVVRTFVDLTSNQMHKLWSRRHGT
jgi:uncharacterized protein (TIGR04255 family)